MNKTSLAAGFSITVVVLGALAVGYRALDRGDEAVVRPLRIEPTNLPTAPPAPASATRSQGFLYGRVTAKDGSVYEGRLRFGGDQEAFWDDHFNGVKPENAWAGHVPPEVLRGAKRPITLLGLEVGEHRHALELARPFQARFGDLTRIESDGRQVRATLKSGTTVDLDRLEAGDFDDGLRIWDRRRGVVALEPLEIRSIELLATPTLDDVPRRLFGTVRTKEGELSGFVAWDRDDSLSTDELRGRTAEGRIALPFDAIRTISRSSPNRTEVELRDGRKLTLLEHREDGPGQRTIQVTDARFGRVSVPWRIFERLDLTSPGEERSASGPAYDEFAAGRPLFAHVTTRHGRELAGRLVFDLDESETTDTLEGTAQGFAYAIPFDHLAVLERPAGGESGVASVRATLRDGSTLVLDSSGDVSERNGGLLLFAPDANPNDAAEYVAWADVARIALDPPPARDTLER